MASHIRLLLLLAVGNRKLNATSSKAHSGLFCLLYTGGLCAKFHYRCILSSYCCSSEWWRAQASLPEFTANCSNFIGREKRVRKKLFLLISKSSRNFPCFSNKWKQRTWNRTDIICIWLMFLKKASYVLGCPWDGRIAFAFKPGTLGTVESERELTSHVCGFLQFSLTAGKLCIEQGGYERKCTDVSLAPLIKVQSSLWFRVSQIQSKKLSYPRDHHILCFYRHSGPLFQSPEDWYLNNGNPERVCSSITPLPSPSGLRGKKSHRRRDTKMTQVMDGRSLRGILNQIRNLFFSHIPSKSQITDTVEFEFTRLHLPC